MSTRTHGRRDHEPDILLNVGTAGRARGSRHAGARRLLAAAWRGSPTLTIVSAALLAVSSVAPAATAVVSGHVVATILRPDRPAGSEIAVPVAILGASFLAWQLMPAVVHAVGRMLGRVIEDQLFEELVASTGEVRTLRHLEDATFLDDLGHVERAIADRIVERGAMASMRLWSARVGGLGSLIVAVGLAPIPTLPVVASIAWSWWYWKSRHGAVMAASQDRGGDLRRSDYLRGLALEPAAAKELRVFGLGAWVADEFHRSWDEAFDGLSSRIRGRFTSAVLPLIVPGVLVTVAIAMVATAEVGSGERDVAALVAYVAAATGASAIAISGDLAAWVADATRITTTIVDLEERVRREPPARLSATTSLPPGHVRLDEVTFTYPGASRPAVHSATVDIEPGTTLALVGENGSGKTTLVKLLAGLLAPDDGSIRVGAEHEGNVDPEAWQRGIAVLFQDFERYQLSLRDNVAFGDVGRAHGDDEIRAALADAGLASLVDDLPHGLDTLLVPHLEHGVDLSGGQWQRVALARALLALAGGAHLLVLDEASAALDARAERDLYDRLLRAAGEVTTVVVSHRFSTVKHADRIVVLHDGHFEEVGTHDELVAARRRYAELYAIQTAAFEVGRA